MSNLLAIVVGALLVFLAYTDQLEIFKPNLEEYKKRKRGGQ